MKNQLILKSRKYLVLSASVVQDIEITEMIAPKTFGSKAHVKPDKKLKKLIGKEIFGAIDFNYPIQMFLFAEESGIAIIWRKPLMSKYQFTPEMREISGFGGGYEEACRKMVQAGLEWFDANTEADPQFHSYKNVYGVIWEDNEFAKELSRVVVDASGGDCTGAMHQAAISHILFVRKNGWEKYVEEMTALKKSAS
jgi:hypothetical protein